MSKEAMKLALEALESYKDFIDDAHILEGQWHWIDGADNAQATREALAEQPAQQEPVAWIVEDQSGERLEWAGDAHSCHGVPTFPLYTSPPAQRKPLTDEEIWDEVKAADLDWQTGWSLDEDAANRYITFARAIEAAHGIKENT